MRAGCLLLLAIAGEGCREDGQESGASSRPDVRAVPLEGVQPEARDDGLMFIDVTADVGLDFEYRGHPPGDYHLPGIMGGGAVVFDADADGRLDIYLVNGHDGSAGSTLMNRLFLQGLDGRFVDATGSSGLGDRGFGMGAAAADIDNDGDEDVYVSNYGPDRLFRNEGDGTFTDVTESAGIRNREWGASIAFLDFDRDGWLDIYVANYVQLDEERVCEDDAGRRDYCGPGVFPGVPDRLFRNRGHGIFEDVSTSSGIASAALAGLGVVAADFDDDGWVDIYVANDRDPNLLWLNQGDGRFIDDAILLGAAYNLHGRPEAGMGVAAGDADEDGDLDLFVTHFRGEKNTLYRSADGIAFDDVTAQTRLGLPSIPYTGWGTAFFDADLDGDLDLAVANGAVVRRSPPLRTDTGFWNEYAEPNHLFLNDGRGRFESAADAAGAFAADIEITRGLIPADIDGDGDLDLLVTNIAGRARLYRNETNASGWVAIRVVDPERRRDAIGAKVSIRTGGSSVVRHVIPPGGYLTSGPATIHLGLPDGDAVAAIDVRWPDGEVEHFQASGRRGLIVIHRGEGTPGEGTRR